MVDKASYLADHGVHRLLPLDRVTDLSGLHVEVGGDLVGNITCHRTAEADIYSTRPGSESGSCGRLTLGP